MPGAFRPVAAGFCLLFAVSAQAHIFVPKLYRLGAFPPYDGSGWVAEVYLDIPDNSALNLLTAEAWVSGREPDFTFHTDWIDFPPGPTAITHDADFDTIGDFFSDYITDVSDPSKLDEPYGNFLVKFSGYIKIAVEHNTSATVGLPVWVDFRTIGQDGYRLVVGMTIYRFPLVGTANFYWQEQPICEAAGMHRIEYTYFNKYDPFGGLRTELSGIELYTWHGGGLPLPGGQNMISENHPEFGPGTIIPPRVIYREEDIVAPIPPGDFDADSDVDLLDYRWFQKCFTGEPQGFPLLDSGCEAFDFDKDVDVDADDYGVLVNLVEGPPTD